MKKALIIGASSGIGRELAITLGKRGYEVGLMARRLEMLEAVQREIPSKTQVGYIDISQVSAALQNASAMVESMGGMDLIVLNAGVGFLNSTLDWSKEKETLAVNVEGTCALAGWAFKYFSNRQSGHLVGISSINALRGIDVAPAYSASKAFLSNYLEGLRKKSFKEGGHIAVTDIRPGYVDTDMAKGEGMFWVATPEAAARQIASAIAAKKSHAYITRRWRLIGWLHKLMPDWLYFRV